MYSSIHPSIHLFIHPSVHPLICSYIYSSIHPLIICWSIYHPSSIYPSICSSIYSSIHLSIHLFNLPGFFSETLSHSGRMTRGKQMRVIWSLWSREQWMRQKHADVFVIDWPRSNTQGQDCRRDVICKCHICIPACFTDTLTFHSPVVHCWCKREREREMFWSTDLWAPLRHTSVQYMVT